MEGVASADVLFGAHRVGLVRRVVHQHIDIGRHRVGVGCGERVKVRPLLEIVPRPLDLATIGRSDGDGLPEIVEHHDGGLGHEPRQWLVLGPPVDLGREVDEIVSEVADVRASKTRGDVGLAVRVGGDLLSELGERIPGREGLSPGGGLENHLAPWPVPENRVTPPTLPRDDAFEQEGRAALGPAQGSIGRHRCEAVRHQGEGGNGLHGAVPR